MAKILKKKFFEVEIPITGEKYELYADSIESLNNKTIKLDITRKLKGKSVDLILSVKIENGKAVAYPKKMIVLPFFINHMMHKGISYVEDSFKAESIDNEILIKPFLITRKKVSRAVRNTLRNSAKNWIIDYLKTKTSNELFEEILSGQFQKPLSLKLKKVYPLALCEIRMIEVKKQLPQKEIIKNEEKAEEIKEVVKEKLDDSKEIEVTSEEESEKPKRKSKTKKED